jgi:hypothetical protein
MQMVVDPLGQSRTDPVNLGEVCNTRLPDPLQAAELPEQGPPALGSQSFDGFQA